MLRRIALVYFTVVELLFLSSHVVIGTSHVVAEGDLSGFKAVEACTKAYFSRSSEAVVQFNQ